jgi:hypothetical protein
VYATALDIVPPNDVGIIPGYNAIVDESVVLYVVAPEKVVIDFGRFGFWTLYHCRFPFPL